MKKDNRVSVLSDYIPLSIAAMTIVIFGAINIYSIAVGNKEGSVAFALFKLLPTLISPIVLVLTAHANRFGFLLGGFNSLLYATTFFIEGLFFSLFTAVVISFPVQLFAFFQWSKNRKEKDKEEVLLKSLGLRKNLLLLIVMAALWCFCYFVIGDLIPAQNYKLLDTIGFVTGMAGTFIAAFRYVESQYITSAYLFCSVMTWLFISMLDISSLNYLINSLYSLYTAVQASVIWTRICIKQKNEGVCSKESTEAKK